MVLRSVSNVFSLCGGGVPTLVPLLLTPNASRICRRRRREASEVPRMASCHVLGKRGQHSCTQRSSCRQEISPAVLLSHPLLPLLPLRLLHPVLAATTTILPLSLLLPVLVIGRGAVALGTTVGVAGRGLLDRARSTQGGWPHSRGRTEQLRAKGGGAGAQVPCWA